MKWHHLVAVVAAIVGCGSERPSLIAAEPAVTRLQRADLESEPDAKEAVANIEGAVTSRLRALVNGKPILDDELRESTWYPLRAADQLAEPQRTLRMQEILKAELDKLIDREVVIFDAEERLKGKRQVWDKLLDLAEKEYDRQLTSMQQRSGVNNEEDFKAKLVEQGMTMTNLKRQIVRSYMSSEYMRSKIFPVIEQLGHNEIRQYYDEHPGEFQNEDSVKWQDIFIDADSPQFPSRTEAQKLADQIASEARRGVDFTQLSSQFNMGESKYRNGEGIGQKRGEVKPPEVEGLVFSMEAGQIKVVELPTGFHIIRLVNRVLPGLQKLDDKTQTEIRRKLQNLIADREYKRIIKDLRRKATIQIFLNDS